MTTHFASKHKPELIGLGVGHTNLSVSLPIPNERLTLIGYSRAADTTSFFIPELSFSLDAGPFKVHTSHPSHVFITHGHSDHSFGMTALVSRAKPPKVYIPISTAPLLDQYLFSSQQLTGACAMTPEEYQTNHVTHGVQPGDIITLDNLPYEITVINCDHSCPSVGFTFHKITHRLRREYQGRAGADLKKLRQDGIDITEICRKSLFTFLGDTTAETLSSEESASWLSTMPVVITECTFLDEKHRKNAEKTKHTLWADLQDPSVQQERHHRLFQRRKTEKHHRVV
ncbi:hypothetical protein PROFUN_10755 [Planoprotostelium fungivorum]|uniref:Metallo-beta-lactamase domain-containing protein n=1 Tax=Planoprotostelium fungivorum TaxID=1890364 RepID=A0A2P6N7Z4_9EUKA|nr:hypothetical protein PROFUN_10755 [Planoprotostelium fungivorum]